MEKQYSEPMKNQMRERLRGIVYNKIMTTMVYPLSQFELAFGHLWGNGKDLDQLDDMEKVNFAKWKECRENIFTNGNNQIRSMNSELDNNTIVWNRHTVTFRPPEANPNRTNKDKE